MNTPQIIPVMNLEFIKLAKSMRQAQQEGLRSQKAQRRAKSLEAIFDARIDAYEKEITLLLESSETSGTDKAE